MSPMNPTSETDKSLALEMSSIGVSLYVCEGDEPVECLAHVARDAADFREQTVRFSRKAQPDWGYHPKIELWFAEDEVLLRNVKLSGRSANARRRSAIEQLSAMTPYNGDELSFDLGEPDTDGYTAIAAIPVKKAEDAMALARSIGMVPTSVTMSDDVDGFAMRPRLMPAVEATRSISRPLQAATFVALLALPLLMFSGNLGNIRENVPEFGGSFLAAVLPDAAHIPAKDGNDASAAIAAVVENDPIEGLFLAPATGFQAPAVDPAPRVGPNATDETAVLISPNAPGSTDSDAASIPPTQVNTSALVLPSEPVVTGAMPHPAAEFSLVRATAPQNLFAPIPSNDSIPGAKVTATAKERAIETGMVMHDLQAAFAFPDQIARPRARTTSRPVTVFRAVERSPRPAVRPQLTPETASIDFDDLAGFSQILARVEKAPLVPGRVPSIPPALIRPVSLSLTLQPDVVNSFLQLRERRRAEAITAAAARSDQPDARLPRPPLRDILPGPGGAGTYIQVHPPGTQNDMLITRTAPLAPVLLSTGPERHDIQVLVAALTSDLRDVIDQAEKKRLARTAEAERLAALNDGVGNALANLPPRRRLAAPEALPEQTVGTTAATTTDSAPVSASDDPAIDVAAAPATAISENADLEGAELEGAEAVAEAASVPMTLLASLQRATPRRPALARAALKANITLQENMAMLPLHRPGDLKNRAAAIRKKRSEVGAIVAAKQQPKAATASSRLNIPSSARVSRTATIRDGIDLGDISLIGIVGKSNARKALIRTPRGKIVRVSKGGSVDGWTVSAISADNVRIRKRSQNQTLRLPN